MHTRRFRPLAIIAGLAALTVAPLSVAAQTDEELDAGEADIIAVLNRMVDGEADVFEFVFADPENPFGLAVTAPPDSIDAEHVTVGTFTPPGDGTNQPVFADGWTIDGRDATFGAPDDEFASSGDLLAASFLVNGPFPEGHVIDFALLVSLGGFTPSSADERLVIDPNEGFTHRFSLSFDGASWNVTFEIWNAQTQTWDVFSTIADWWVDVGEALTTAHVVVPPRFWSGVERLEAHVTDIPQNATDPAEAFFVRSVLGTDFPSLNTIVDTLTDEERERAADVASGVLNPEPEVVQPEVAQPAEIEPEADDPPVEPEPSVIEAPAVEEPAVEEPVVEPEQPVEEPVIEEPVIDDPVEEPVVEASADEPTLEDPPSEPVAVSESGDGGGLSPIVPIGGLAIAAIAAGGTILVRRRQPSPLPVGDEEAEAGPTTPVPSPLAPVGEHEAEPVLNGSDDPHPPVEATRPIMAGAVEGTSPAEPEFDPQSVEPAMATAIEGTRQVEPEPETDLSGLIDTPEQRAVTEMIEGVRTAGEPETSWGDGTPPAPIWEDERLAELDLEREILGEQQLIDDVVRISDRVFAQQVRLGDLVSDYRQRYDALSTDIATIDALLDARANAIETATTADTVVGVTQLGMLGVRGTRFGVRYMFSDDIVVRPANAARTIDDLPDEITAGGFSNTDEMVPSGFDDWDDWLGDDFDHDFFDTLTYDDKMWIGLHLQSDWKNVIDPTELQKLAHRAGIDDLDAWRIAHTHPDRPPLTDRGVATSLLQLVQQVEGWVHPGREITEALQQLSTRLTVASRGDEVTLTPGDIGVLRRLINDPDLVGQIDRIPLIKTNALDGDLEAMLLPPEVGRIRALVAQLDPALEQPLALLPYEINAASDGVYTLTMNVVEGADLNLAEVDDLLAVLDQMALAVAGQGDISPESVIRLREIVAKVDDFFETLPAVSIRAGFTIAHPFNTQAVEWLQTLHEEGTDVRAISQQLGPITTAAITNELQEPWWTNVDTGSILTTGVIDGAHAALGGMDRPFIFFGPELPSGPVSIVAHSLTGLVTAPIETSTNVIFMEAVGPEMDQLFSAHGDSIGVMADDVAGAAVILHELDEQLSEWTLADIATHARRVDGMADLYEQLLDDAPDAWRDEHETGIQEIIDDLRAISGPATVTIERVTELDALLASLAQELEQRVTDPASGDPRPIADAIESPTVIRLGSTWNTFQTTLGGGSRLVPLR